MDYLCVTPLKIPLDTATVWWLCPILKGEGGQVGKTVKTSDVGFGENCEPQDQKVEGVINGNKRKHQCFFFTLTQDN